MAITTMVMMEQNNKVKPGGVCKQVSPGRMTCTPILKYNGHCGIEDPETMTSYEVECPN
jgi:hypothetical protein